MKTKQILLNNIHSYGNIRCNSVRGDVILELDYSNFTKRAVLEATHAHDLAS